MNFIQRIFPKEANNIYRGSKIAYYTLWIISLIFLFRASFHFLAPDSGVNTIASIIKFNGDPDPNNIIYMFSSLGGAMQFMMVIIYLIVLIRYKSLIPLAYSLLLIETIFRYVVAYLHPITPDYYVNPPPDTLAELPILLITIIMLFLSLREKNIKAN